MHVFNTKIVDLKCIYEMHVYIKDFVFEIHIFIIADF